ncbi:hypothetical protein DRP53_05410 [candidate division WOR-3 bacterium]|uniref:Uncharacterized protein n=1 Tax=candidate division WOR-3 bacterium TaxID=2052148 RepID=A0A660SHM4_UNCW3|nr:MAG: hypothetical protein DRP53_05410 [candidate division WOR-3 bacterium]
MGRHPCHPDHQTRSGGGFEEIGTAAGREFIDRSPPRGKRCEYRVRSQGEFPPNSGNYYYSGYSNTVQVEIPFCNAPKLLSVRCPTSDSVRIVWQDNSKIEWKGEIWTTYPPPLLLPLRGRRGGGESFDLTAIKSLIPLSLRLDFSIELEVV